MKKILTKVIGLVGITGVLFANDNVFHSIGNLKLEKQSAYNLTKSSNHKNFLKQIRYKAISRIAKTLNLNPKLFDDNQKFSLYVKIASTKKIGFKYKF